MSSSTVTIGPMSEYARNVRPPPSPSNPPSAADIAQSVLYKHQMVDLLKVGKVTNDDVMACIDYENALLESRQGAAPPWFESAMSRHLDPIRDDIKTLKDDVNALKGDVQSLKDDVNTIKDDVKTVKDDMKAAKIQQNKTLRIAALTFNASQPNGVEFPLAAVPNEHGTDIPRDLGSRPLAQVIADLTFHLGL